MAEAADQPTNHKTVNQSINHQSTNQSPGNQCIDPENSVFQDTLHRGSKYPRTNGNKQHQQHLFGVKKSRNENERACKAWALTASRRSVPSRHPMHSSLIHLRVVEVGKHPRIAPPLLPPPSAPLSVPSTVSKGVPWPYFLPSLTPPPLSRPSN